MLAVGGFGKLNIMPSGGITPENADSWFKNGAAAVGMGSKLVGKDVRTSKDDKSYEADAAEWVNSGRKAAKELFEKMNSSRNN